MPTEGLPPWVSFLGWLVAAMLGSGGLAAWIRARGQNKNEASTSLTQEQQSFRKDLRDQIDALARRNEYVIGRLDAVSTHNSELVQLNAKLEAKVELQQAKIEQQEVRIDDLSSQLTVLFAERRKQDDAIKRLEDENGRQQGQIHQLQSENMDCHKLIAEQSQLLMQLQVMKEVQP